MADNSTEFPTEHLEESNLSLLGRVCKYRKIGVRLMWAVHNYSKLLKNVSYFKDIYTNQFYWKFSLVKAKGMLFLSLSTLCTNLNVLFIIISHDLNIQPISLQCTEVSSGLYVNQICNHIIVDPGNKYLDNDVLIIRCFYAESAETIQRTVPYGQFNSRSDAHDLCENFKTLALKGLCSDFVIESGEHMFPTHKLILRARSKYFSSMFAAEEAKNIFRSRIVIPGNPLNVLVVLLYMYTAELQDMVVYNTIEVFYLANYLMIPSLIKRCVHILKGALTPSNAQAILKAANENKDVGLKNAAARILLKTAKYVVKQNE